MALALSHQAVAIVVLTISVMHVERLERRPSSSRVGTHEDGDIMRSGEPAR
jgi:hypothetical protein